MKSEGEILGLLDSTMKELSMLVIMYNNSNNDYNRERIMNMFNLTYQHYDSLCKTLGHSNFGMQYWTKWMK